MCKNVQRSLPHIQDWCERASYLHAGPNTIFFLIEVQVVVSHKNY